jgi:hypothetical protein
VRERVPTGAGEEEAEASCGRAREEEAYARRDEVNQNDENFWVRRITHYASDVNPTVEIRAPSPPTGVFISSIEVTFLPSATLKPTEIVHLSSVGYLKPMEITVSSIGQLWPTEVVVLRRFLEKPMKIISADENILFSCSANSPDGPCRGTLTTNFV